jgi:hypothetical protein
LRTAIVIVETRFSEIFRNLRQNRGEAEIGDRVYLSCLLSRDHSDERAFVFPSFRMNVTTTFGSAVSGTVNSIIGLQSEVRLNKATSNAIDVSPVTLSSDWPRVGRLSLLAVLAGLGSMGNVFMISAVVVEDQLSKRGTAA